MILKHADMSAEQAWVWKTTFNRDFVQNVGNVCKETRAEILNSFTDKERSLRLQHSEAGCILSSVFLQGYQKTNLLATTKQTANPEEDVREASPHSEWLNQN